jgi:Fic-DOC domain mobile mystery protein B
LQISIDLKALLDDAMYWITNEVFPPDEIAIRFKHKLVSIHCFANGNGRHSRLMADIIIEKLYNQPVFTWGSASSLNENDIRDKYLRAIKAADKRDFSLLLEFVRL